MMGDGVDATGSICVTRWWCCNDHLREASMNEVTTIGLDIAKQAFHVHGADALGSMLFSRRIAEPS
jgi:hypothetical protein